MKVGKQVMNEPAVIKGCFISIDKSSLLYDSKIMHKSKDFVQTNWVVITGGPSIGKSKLTTHLSFLGYSTSPEPARIHIDDELSKGRTLEEIRKDDEAFQKRAIALKMDIENRTNVNDLVFFDRGLPDGIVFLNRCNSDPAYVKEECKKRRYRAIFLLDMLPFYISDYARLESKETSQEIHEQLRKCYLNLGYDVIRVPVAPISERAKFILNKLSFMGFGNRKVSESDLFKNQTSIMPAKPERV